MTKEYAKTEITSEAVELLTVDDGKRQQAADYCKESGQNLEGVAWFMSDMRSRRLAWVKAIFFLQTAGLVTLYPYLAIHMRYITAHNFKD